MIKLTNVNKVYGKGDSAVHALKDVNLELPSGKFIAIVGKSGSGKSTLMNIVGALDSCTSGEVEIDGEVLNNKNANQLADYRNRKIGYIFQSFYLEPTFTVLENVAMPMTIAGIKRKERELKALQAIESLNLSEKANKKASELSGGQKQRVSIARALVFDPDIILADEPTGNLDSQNGQEVIALLQKICDSGKTVLLVTHNIDDARKTDIMVEIKDGIIANIIENDEETKRAAQHASDYDEQGNLIEKPSTATESMESVVATTTDDVAQNVAEEIPEVAEENPTVAEVTPAVAEETSAAVEETPAVAPVEENVATEESQDKAVEEIAATTAVQMSSKIKKVAPKPKVVSAEKKKPVVVDAEKVAKSKVVKADKASKPAAKKVEKIEKVDK